jgi:zinc protease
MLDRTLPPPSYPIDKFELPSYEEISSASGSPIFVIYNHQLPLVQVDLIFESGKSQQVIPGTSYYAIKMLAEGTSSQSAEDIANAFESRGSFVEFGSGIDHSSIKIYSQSAHILPTLDLLKELLMSPSFPENKFETLKQIRAQQIRQQHAKNSQFATAQFNQKLFGKQHPIGQILKPEEALKTGLDDVIDFYKNRLYHNPTILLTGDVSDALIKSISELVNDLPIHANKPISTSVKPNFELARYDKSSGEQVSFRQGMFNIDKQHKDIHGLTIANTLLGGFFGSRLMKKIREEHGYTYGIYSMFVHTLSNSYWMISSEMKKQYVEQGAEAIAMEIEKLAKTPPHIEELNTLKNYLKGKLLSSMDSIFSQANIIKGLKLQNLNDSYYDDYVKTIDLITPEALCDLTKQHLLDPQKATLFFG